MMCLHTTSTTRKLSCDFGLKKKKWNQDIGFLVMVRSSSDQSRALPYLQRMEWTLLWRFLAMQAFLFNCASSARHKQIRNFNWKTCFTQIILWCSSGKNYGDVKCTEVRSYSKKISFEELLEWVSWQWKCHQATNTFRNDKKS